VNGTPEQQIFDFGKFSGDERYYQPGLLTFNSFNNSTPRLATNIELHRIDGTQVEGSRKDYPIDYITYYDGYQSYHTSYSFDAATGKFDPNGNTIQYGEAEVFPGNSTQANTYGHTVFQFFNGLPESGNTSHDNSGAYYGRFIGQQKSTEVFNSSGTMVSSSENTHFYYAPSTAQSESNIGIEHGYVVPKSAANYLDGVRNSTTTEYLVATGQPYLTRESAVKLTGMSDRRTTTITYGWQVYSGMDTKNILNVPVSTQVDYNNKIINHQVTKMKEELGR